MEGFCLKFLAVALFAVCITLTQTQRQIIGGRGCGEREVFKRCGSNCPRSCQSMRSGIQSPVCSNQCVPGCFCEDQYVRGFDGKCVFPRDCFRAQQY
uniref:U28-Liphistoxin-Lth1a_1 n=1 Tax=Liphistius thaleban TaxID=1905330 RepID=A0A4Q8K3Q6_9ARAC